MHLAVLMLAPPSVYELTAKCAKSVVGEEGGKMKRGGLGDGAGRNLQGLMI